MSQGPNAGQSDFWNSGPGQVWVRRQADLDQISGNVGRLLIEACAPAQGERVLDIGCGTGATSFALADAVGPTGRVIGLDIAKPLLAHADARRLALGFDNVSFQLADAQEYSFAPGTFDLVASRFGVMFFSDPVAAFANMRRGLGAGGRIAFATWAGAETNPWFSLSRRVAADRLGPGAPADPDGPGPMAFRDIARVLGILSAAGFSGAAGRLVHTELHHPGGVGAVVDLSGEIGPAASLLREKNGTQADRQAIAEQLRIEYRPFASADGIRIPAEINIFTAVRP